MRTENHYLYVKLEVELHNKAFRDFSFATRKTEEAQINLNGEWNESILGKEIFV